jgi:hypothetical protein
MDPYQVPAQHDAVALEGLEDLAGVLLQEEFRAVGCATSGFAGTRCNASHWS